MAHISDTKVDPVLTQLMRRFGACLSGIHRGRGAIFLCFLGDLGLGRYSLTFFSLREDMAPFQGSPHLREIETYYS